MRTVRLFIALPISAEIRKGCATLQKAGTAKAPSVRWVDPEQIHLTLIFLGWTDPSLQTKIEGMIQEVSAASPPFSVKVGGLGVFPRLRSPKVVWLGVSEEGALMALQKRLAMGMDALGFPMERRPYRPHLTLGRIREGEGSDPFTHWITQGETLHIGECAMKEVVLMESRLKPGGSAYTARFAAPLLN